MNAMTLTQWGKPRMKPCPISGKKMPRGGFIRHIRGMVIEKGKTVCACLAAHPQNVRLSTPKRRRVVKW